MLKPPSLFPSHQPKQKDKKGLSRSTFPDLHPDKENVLLTTFVTKEYYKKGNTTPSDMEVSRMYHVFNIKTKKTEKMFTQFPGILNFSIEDTDVFDWNNFLSDYQPEGKDYYEIGRFIPVKNQYIPIITNNQTTNATLIKVFTKQNLVFFYKAKRRTEYQDLWVMNLNGTNQRNITNGKYVMVKNCILLDNERVYIDGGIEKDNSGFDMIYYPEQNKVNWLFQDVKLWTQFVEIYQNQLLMRISKDNSEKEELCLFDYDGNKIRTICTIPENYHEDVLFDAKGSRIFIAYKSIDKNYKIIMINLFDSKVMEIFFRPTSVSYDIKLFLNQPGNFIYFRLEESEQKDGKYKDKDTFHHIDLNTFKDDFILLPDFTNNYTVSEDGNFIFSFNEYGYPEYNGIIDFKTKKIAKFDKKIQLGYIFPFYIPSIKQFCFCLDSDDPKEIYFVDLDGKVTKYLLWK